MVVTVRALHYHNGGLLSLYLGRARIMTAVTSASTQSATMACWSSVRLPARRSTSRSAPLWGHPASYYDSTSLNYHL